MTNIVYQDIPRFYTAIAEWSACVVFILILKKRFSNQKMIWYCLVAFVLQSVFFILTGDLPVQFWIPCMLTAVGEMYLFIYCLSQSTWKEAGYCLAVAFLAAEFAASLEWLIYTAILMCGIDYWWVRVLLLVVIYMGVFTGAFWLERSLLTEEYLNQLSGWELISALGISVATFAFSNICFIVTDDSFTSQIRLYIFSIRTLADLAGIAVLYAFQSRISEYMTEKEAIAIRNMLRSQYDQYRNYQDSMDMIQMQYHDLKHHIAGLRGETDAEKRIEWLDTMERELDANGIACQTGNHVLDTILGAKLLLAKKKHIRITCVADGTLLNFLHVTDICTIFGNALDNAIESVILLEDEQKRLIHLSMSSRKNFIFISVRNYCEQELNWGTGGELRTTKSDKNNHGFGLKSIRYSAEKYGGSVTIRRENNWFELSILIPYEKMEKTATCDT